jgi:hypothetical protein
MPVSFHWLNVQGPKRSSWLPGGVTFIADDAGIGRTMTILFLECRTGALLRLDNNFVLCCSIQARFIAGWPLV